MNINWGFQSDLVKVHADYRDRNLSVFVQITNKENNATLDFYTAAQSWKY